MIVQYFIGGPLDLTKRYVEHEESVVYHREAIPGVIGEDDPARVIDHRYLVAGKLSQTDEVVMVYYLASSKRSVLAQPRPKVPPRPSPAFARFIRSLHR